MKKILLLLLFLATLAGCEEPISHAHSQRLQTAPTLTRTISTTSSPPTPDQSPAEKMLQLLNEAGAGSLIHEIKTDGYNATITVANGWHYMVYQERLQSAQNLWKIWATLSDPPEYDHAFISITDYNGNRVGGSRWLAGSLIWVKK